MAKDSYKSKGDSDSPLATRRGNADPVDVDPSPVQTNAGELHHYNNTVEPRPPVEATGAGETDSKLQAPDAVGLGESRSRCRGGSSNFRRQA